MKRISMIIVGAFLMLGASVLSASAQNEISKTSVEEIAKKEVKRLASQKKIPKSWKSMAISKIGKTHYGDSNDWVVGFDNPKIKNKTKRTLYIFVTVKGKVVGANYTGR